MRQHYCRRQSASSTSSPIPQTRFLLSLIIHRLHHPCHWDSVNEKQLTTLSGTPTAPVEATPPTVISPVDKASFPTKEAKPNPKRRTDKPFKTVRFSKLEIPENESYQLNQDGVAALPTPNDGGLLLCRLLSRWESSMK